MAAIIRPSEGFDFVVDSDSFDDDSDDSYQQYWNDSDRCRYPSQYYIRQNSCFSPQAEQKAMQMKRSISTLQYPLTVFLDLDNTLIHAEMSVQGSYDFTVSVEDDYKQGEMVTVYITKRPHLIDFLTKVSTFAKIYLYTAADKSYAEQILSYIDPTNQYFSGCFYRDSCKLNPTKHTYVKDIDIIASHPARTILVDDSIDSFGGRLENAIQISPFLGDPNDRELETLDLILETLKGYDDVRPILRTINSSL